MPPCDLRQTSLLTGSARFSIRQLLPVRVSLVGLGMATLFSRWPASRLVRGLAWAHTGTQRWVRLAGPPSSSLFGIRSACVKEYDQVMWELKLNKGHKVAPRPQMLWLQTTNGPDSRGETEYSVWGTKSLLFAGRPYIQPSYTCIFTWAICRYTHIQKHIHAHAGTSKVCGKMEWKDVYFGAKELWNYA